MRARQTSLPGFNFKTAKLLLHAKAIERILAGRSKIFGVKLYQSANAGDHLHLVIRAHSRRTLRGYLRSISGIIARRVSGVERGAGRMKGSSAAKDDLPGQKSRVSLPGKSPRTPNVAAPRPTFWDARPFSRLVTWGRDYARIKNYLQINRNEMIGLDRLSARAMLTRIKEFQRSTGLVSLGFGTG